MNRTKLAALFVGTYALIASLYLLRVDQKLASLVFLFPPLLASVLGYYAAKTYKIVNIHGRAMAFLASGMAAFFIGETIFYVYQYHLNRQPFPSVADAFYLLAYPLVLVGLMIEVRMHKPRLSDFSRQTLSLMFTALVSTTAIVCYFGIYKAFDSAAGFTVNAFAMGYGVADLIILVPAMYVLNLAYEFKGGKLFNTWMMIFFAILLMLGGDILFALYNEQYSDAQWPYTLIDLFWTASYLLFGYSFIFTASVLKDLRKRLLETKPTPQKR